jgi:ribosomal protein S5
MGPKKSLKSRAEWLERVVAIERVTKVVKGGKKNEFPSYYSSWKRKG